MKQKILISFIYIISFLPLKAQKLNHHNGLPSINFLKPRKSLQIKSKNKNAEKATIVLSIVKYPNGIDGKDGELKATYYGSCPDAFCEITLSNGNTSYSYGVDSPAIFKGVKHGRYKVFGPYAGEESNYVDLLPCLEPTNQVSNAIFGDKTNTTLSLENFIPPIIPPHLPPEISQIDGYVIFINDSHIFSPPEKANSYEAELEWKDKGQQTVYFGNSTNPDLTVFNLDPNSTYFFKIYAYRMCGDREYYETTGLLSSDTTLENSLSTSSQIITKAITFNIEKKHLVLKGLRINNSEIKIKVYDFLGKVLMDKSFEAKYENFIDVSHFTNGMYIVHLNYQSQIISKKIIIQ